MEAAAQGHGGCCWWRADAGIGKTRLLAEARTMAIEAEPGAARARASGLERDFAFGVVRQLFERLLTHTEPAGLDAVWEVPAAQARGVFTLTSTAGAG